ncbi:MFS transporter [Rathayibacter sp. YIM 133350]|uniref:MFS transporter n=1 Tax=Rathayibacter sp. YIM 133350 TaxID=3131992 RepID=UPI00307E3716
MTPRDTAARAFPWLLVTGIALVALNLRTPIIAIAPVLREIEHDLGLTPTTAGLLTSIPVLCFALATPIATAVIRWTGSERAIVFALLGVFAGTLLRSADGFPLALAGTVVIGVAITIGNVVVPVVIRRDVPPHRAQLVTGIYTAMLNVGSMLATLGTAPLAEVVGWRWATASWAALVILALVVWGVHLRRMPPEVPETGSVTTDPPASAWRTPITWLLAGAFSAQAFSYYGMTTWLPSILSDEQGLDVVSSGTFSSVFQISAVIGALGVPLLGARTPRWVPAAVIGVLWVSLPAGMLLAPNGFLLWSILGGIAQGGGFTVVFSIIVRVARSNRQATQMSALVQAAGYLVAALAPPLLGAVHEAVGGWTASITLVLVSTIAFLVLAIASTLLADRLRTRTRTP